MYRWENSISRGVSRVRGDGFTVTEMTLEFSTVAFLGREGNRHFKEDRDSYTERVPLGYLK